MANNPNKSVRRIINASRFSWQGLRAAYKHEEAFRQEFFLLLISVPLALWLGDNALEIGLMVSSIILVLIVEILNSAIEAVVDRFGGEMHELSGRAKDMGSAAVSLALLYALVCWISVLLM
ncbi:MAG: Diacylglycerol kinase (EC [uncultured Thiotrichaceae bacterium]|uniref:Diacylglycerol kinase n=1 Tax=uncultured Thiotrichaceae bacterium TaxID=298394 RepID=A0A6S6TEL3_9GAMM|nr:MAG: Diacylglycerol kinase (EC [uncultured Thiotrichaceae bacterium]